MAVQLATDSEFYRNYSDYLQKIMDGDEIIVTRDGREILRALAPEKDVSFLSDSLRGVLKRDNGYDKQAIWEERARHASPD